MEEKLKPCPFCGEPGHLAPICKGSSLKIDHWAVTCENQEIGTYFCVVMQEGETKEDAINRWNRREPHAKLVAALKELLDDCDEAADALNSSYNVQDYPGDGDTRQDHARDALRSSTEKARAALKEIAESQCGCHCNTDPDWNVEEKLKPCPFCGGSDRLLTMGRGDRGYQEECESCAARGPIVIKRTESPAAWNRRADNATLVAALRRIKGNHDRCSEEDDCTCPSCIADAALREGREL